MKLLPRYATACNLKIGKQHLLETFFPLPFIKYITLHSSSGMQGKNYPFYQIVVDMLNPILAPLDIRIVQMGLKEDQDLSGCYHIKGKTNMHQGNHILSNSLLHIGNDSVWCHRAGYLGKPLVELFGPTTIANHSPHQFDADKTVLLESHRWNKKATFASQENPMSIALIPPEQVAASVLKLLKVPHPSFPATQFIGPIYLNTLFDVVPSFVPQINLSPDIPFTIRMDITFNEQNLLAILQSGRKVTIVTKAPINIQLLAAFRANILSYNHEIDAACPLEYPAQVKSLIPNTVFFTRAKDDADLAALRFHFFDSCPIEQVMYSSREDYVKGVASYLNQTEDTVRNNLDISLKSDTLRATSHKFILSDGKIYLSYAHLKAGIAAPEFTATTIDVIDDEAFWRDINHFMIYETEK